MSLPSLVQELISLRLEVEKLRAENKRLNDLLEINGLSADFDKDGNPVRFTNDAERKT